MKLGRPKGFEPVRGFGEWVGFLGGLFVAAALAAAIIGVVAWNGYRLVEGKVTFSALACVDVTDPCNWSTYSAVNDSAQTVVLRECFERCEAGDGYGEAVILAPGKRSSGEAVRAEVGERAWWEVLTDRGVRIGCLVLDGHEHKHDGEVVLISSAGPCGSARTTPTLRP